MKFDEFFVNNSSQISQFKEEYPINYEHDAVKDIFQQIKILCQPDVQLFDYYEKMVESCYSYTDIVCQFNFLMQDYQGKKISEEEYRDRFNALDQARSVIHNSTIDSFNILSRLMAEKKINNDWIAPLVQGGRVVYGAYAIKKTLLDIFENLNNNK